MDFCLLLCIGFPLLIQRLSLSLNGPGHHSLAVGEALIQGNGNTCIDHILAVPHAAADAEHQVILRTVEHAQRHGVSIPVITVAYSHTEFVVHLNRMQRRQSRRACANFIQSVVHFVNTVTQIYGIIVRTLSNILNLILNLSPSSCISINLGFFDMSDATLFAIRTYGYDIIFCAIGISA